ncbi:hypothetical protein BGZ67_000530 [Mortierella alpina]|nr:hypothetical protein BGZ67_000530 [Mortierella alpina]
MGLVKQAVASQWKYGIQQEQDYCGALEIKLQGNPWQAKGDESVYARMMLAQMIANFQADGFKLYASIGIGAGSDGHDVQSWVLRRVLAANIADIVSASGISVQADLATAALDGAAIFDELMMAARASAARIFFMDFEYENTVSSGL